MSLPGICASSVSHHGLHWKTLRSPSKILHICWILFIYMMTISYSKQLKSTMTIFFCAQRSQIPSCSSYLGRLLKLECGSTHASQINIVTHLCYNQICITQNPPVLQNPAIAPSPVFCAFLSFSRFFAMRGCIALALFIEHHRISFIDNIWYDMYV